VVFLKRIDIVLGDITKVNVDAIVNAANSTLLGGGGVDGAIHRAAGPELLEECRKLNGCESGKAKITKGYKLPAKYVIHTVGPIWRGGNANEDELLASCYRNSLQLAVENSIKTIAFPSISTGAYRFPLKRAAKIAILEISKFLKNNKSIEKVLIVCFDKGTMNAYSEALSEI
jgi:O-acetyl-ADP-ribose deacetylase (regulator of RNase III)